ncbi:EamA family transporter [bacterium BMS3Abin03]|jgi:drug/metabolite transporter (DMT)-like permease|nr:EamA family transporter [bacterium BMS3Abin03]
MSKPTFRAYIAWVAICIIWGTTYLAIRIGVADLPPMLFAGFRWITASIILIFVLRLTGKQLPKKSDLIHLAIVGIALLGFGNGLVVTAEQSLPSGLTALLITTLPFWMVGFESLRKKGPKLNYLIVIGLIFGLAGVITIFGVDLSSWLSTKNIFGVLALMGSEIAWALGSIYSKYHKVSVHPLMGAAVQMLIAGLAQTALGTVLGEFSWFHLTQNGILAMVYLIVVGAIFGYASYIYAISELPLSFVSTYAYINPIIALILGWYILNEELSINLLFAVILIFSGVILVRKGSFLAQQRMKKPATTNEIIQRQ